MKVFHGVRGRVCSRGLVFFAVAIAGVVAASLCSAADEKQPGSGATATTASPKPAAIATANTKAKPLAAPNVEDAWERRIPRFDVDNVPLAEVVKLLRNEFPELNFLIRNGTVSAGSEAVNLGDIAIKVELRNVTLSEMLKATELAAERPIAIKADPSDRLIVFEPAKEVAPLERPPVVTRAYNLGVYLAGLNEEQTNKALQDLYEVIEITNARRSAITGGKKGNMNIHFHPGTKLLIVIGRPDELEVVEQIASELQGRGSTPTGGFSAPGKYTTRPGAAVR